MVASYFIFIKFQNIKFNALLTLESNIVSIYRITVKTCINRELAMFNHKFQNHFWYLKFLYEGVKEIRVGAVRSTSNHEFQKSILAPENL